MLKNKEAKKEKIVYAYVDEDSESVGWYEMWKDEIEYYGDSVIVCGNRDYVEENVDVLKQFDTLNNASYEYENKYFKNFTEFVETYISKDNKKAFSKRELGRIKQILLNCDYNLTEDDYVELLSIVKCKPYKIWTMKGYDQRDWQNIYCPEELSREAIDYMEAIYFGKGNDVAISDDLSFEDCCWNFYTHDIIWNEPKLIELIKRDTGADKVVLCDRKTHTTYGYVAKEEK